MRECGHERKYGEQRAGDRRPQSCNQECTVADREYVEDGSFHCQTWPIFAGSMGNERRSRNQAHEQKPGSGQTTGES